MWVWGIFKILFIRLRSMTWEVCKCRIPSQLWTHLTCYVMLALLHLVCVTWGPPNADQLFNTHCWEHVRTCSTVWPLWWCKRFCCEEDGGPAAFGDISLPSTFSMFFNLVWFGFTRSASWREKCCERKEIWSLMWTLPEAFLSSFVFWLYF